MHTTHQDAPALRGLTVSEAAHQLGIGKTLLYKIINDGLIQPVKLGRRTIIPTEQISNLLSSARRSKGEGVS